MKCRSCQFRTEDLSKVLEHISTLGHEDWAYMEGTVVKVDWIHLEIVRGAPQ